MPPHAAHPHPTRSRATARFERVGFAWLTLFAAAAALGPQLLAWAVDLGFALNAHGHAHLHAHGHPFADARALLGIPNALDVLSNLAFAVVAGMGVLAMLGAALPSAERAALRVAFAGLALTTLGSSAYHWAPGPWGLVADRLGMAVAFAGVLALVVALRVSAGASRATLAVLLPLGVCAATLAHTAGNVLPWALVQFGGVAVLASLALSRPAPSAALRVDWLWLLTGYVCAKLLELNDAAIFEATHRVVSGHTLKHLAAAAAAWPLVAACKAAKHSAPAQ